VCATVGTQHWIYNVTGSPATSLYKVWTYEDVEYGTQQGEPFFFMHTVRYLQMRPR
jgi:hypothetical protein